MEYEIIEAQELQEVVEEVKIWIKSGWKPQGGITAICVENEIKNGHDSNYSGVFRGLQPKKFKYMQAMVKEIEPIKIKKEI